MAKLGCFLTLYDPSLNKPEKHLPIGQEVHVPPRDPRLAGINHCQAGSQDGVVDELLLVGELAVCRVGAGDVGAEAVVLAAHVEEDDVAVLDGLHAEQSSIRGPSTQSDYI